MKEKKTQKIQNEYSVFYKVTKQMQNDGCN